MSLLEIMTLRTFTFYYFLLYINDAIAVQELFCEDNVPGYGLYTWNCNNDVQTSCLTLIWCSLLAINTVLNLQNSSSAP